MNCEWDWREEPVEAEFIGFDINDGGKTPIAVCGKCSEGDNFRKFTSENREDIIFYMAAASEWIVEDFNTHGEVLQVGHDDDVGLYGPNSAIGRLERAMWAWDEISG